MRSGARLGAVLLTLGVAAFIFGGQASPSRAATSAPALLRDVEAARFLVHPAATATTTADVIQPDTQIEPSVAANPNNPLNAVVGFQEGRRDSGGDYTNGYATTFDGGKTWTFGELPKLTKWQGSSYDRASDAALAFGNDNTVYYNSLIFNIETGNGLLSGMAVNISHDGGKTWSDPAVIQSDMLGGLNDKNWIVVDRGSGPGHHQGRVYVVWDRVVEEVYNYCDANCEDAANWFAQSLPWGAGQGIGSFPVVLNDGSLGIIYNALPGGTPPVPGEQPDANTTGAENLSIVLAPAAGSIPTGAPLVFTPPIGIAVNRTNGVSFQRAGGLPAADVDPLSGAIYAVWEDGRFRTEATNTINDAVFSKSTDGGMTWGPVTKINPGPANDFVNHYNVAVSAGSDGSVRVMYRQRVEGLTEAKYSRTVDTFYQESRDGGATWSSPLKVDQQQATTFGYGALSRGGLFEGDYNQLAAAGPYTYVARDEAYPISPGETPGIILQSDGTAYVLNTAGCGDTVTSACLTHQHQRTWVGVIGPAQAVAPAATPTLSVLAQSLPGTSAPVPSWVGLALLTVAALVYGAIAWLRRRRPVTR